MKAVNYRELSKQYPLKRALITGAGSGLGLELTKLLLNDGWCVAALDIHVQALEKQQSALLFISEIDVTNRASLQQIIDAFCNQQNGIDLLFNNAGVGEGTLFKDYALKNWDWIIDINLKAVIDATHFVLPYMHKANSGLIVNMASMAGIANLPRMSPYNVTKAALISLSETLNHELCDTDISVTCVTPTFFQSSIMQHSKGDPAIISSASKIVSSSALTSLDAANIILKNLHKKKEFVRFPLSAHTFFYSRKFIPSLYKKIVRKFLYKRADA
ncbi:SDR family NAD(P)-dependent oxidoreductase [Cytophaga aurantiaca]|uniref:SDR family NAD(P)-dependent oxidoreductase n=1 Tax=Cytophaga aurantiaca TaxID=29530 RepID=UPI00037E5F83|nr:SDR family NAD(P)-dependent oxidoreductase [Cytophaga aurantiaca]